MKISNGKNLKTTFFYLILLSFITLPTLALAADDKFGLETTADTASLSKTTDLPVMAGQVINYLFGVVGVIFLTVILIGGYFWMTAGGSEEKVGKAKQLIINGVNGMIVIFLAYGLVYIVLFSLGKATLGT